MALHNVCSMIDDRPAAPRGAGQHLFSGARRRFALLAGLLMGLVALNSATHAEQTGAAAPTPEESRMWMTVGERRFGITLTPSPAARALLAQLPLTLHMEDLNRNEKHAELPKAIPTQAAPAGTIRSGDFMLYGSTTLVVFYAGLNSSYAYTRLGRIDNPGNLRDALGTQSVRIIFSKN